MEDFQRGSLNDESEELVDQLSNWHDSGPKDVNQMDLLVQKDRGLILIDEAGRRSVVALIERAEAGGCILNTRQSLEHQVLPGQQSGSMLQHHELDLQRQSRKGTYRQARSVEEWIDRSGPVDRRAG